MCVEFGQNACTAMGAGALKVDLDDDEYFIVPAWINADAQTRLGDEILSGILFCLHENRLESLNFQF